MPVERVFLCLKFGATYGCKSDLEFTRIRDSLSACLPLTITVCREIVSSPHISKAFSGVVDDLTYKPVLPLQLVRNSRRLKRL